MKTALKFIVVASCCIFVQTLAVEKDEVSEPPQTNNANQSDSGENIVTGAKAWALGSSAMLIERNHGRHDLLGTAVRTDHYAERMKSFLKTSGWDINNRDDLLENLQWVEKGGHRIIFEKQGEYLKGLDSQEYEQVLDKSKYDRKELQRIKIAKEYYLKLGQKSLLGWDYSRYICLCRWGYMAGYLTEDEVWKRIMPVAVLLQKHFDSWEDLGQNYIIGRQFWSYQATQESGYMFEDAYQRLLDMPSSPWNKLPWNLDLREEKTDNDPNAPGGEDITKDEITN
jgi:hypothetical protein